MKRKLHLFPLILAAVVFLSISTIAQNNVGINTKSPNPNTALDIRPVGKQGIQIPRLAAADTLVAPLNSASLSLKDKGLLFYDTLGTQFLYWNGQKWQKLGASGINGTNGTNGIDGKTVLNGTIDPITTIGNNGDFYINTTTDKIFGPKTTGAWPAGVSLVGANGTPGTNGLDGKTVLNGTIDPITTIGNNGDFYINTTTDKIFGPKTAGAWPAGVSLVGPNGTPGTNGVDGKTVLNGTIDPSTTIGNNGDFYINTTTDKIFGPKTAGAWPAGISLVGASGTPGTNGLDGKTVLNGIIDPITAIGNNGDFYINTTSNMLFGPKTAGAWPTGVSLVGPNGTPGTNGVDGKTVLNDTIDPSTTIGNNGDFYINTTSNTLFGPKAAGTWPSMGTALVGTNGTNGSNGNTVLNGIADPVTATGNNGDFYINTTTNKIFGPKAAGVWPVGISLIGTNNNVAFSATNSSTTSILSGNWTMITFDSEIYDQSGDFSGSTFKASTNGFYHFDASVGFSSAGNNKRYIISLTLNGTQERAISYLSSSSYFNISISADLQLSAGDKVDIRVWENDVTTSTLPGSFYTYFNGHKIF